MPMHKVLWIAGSIRGSWSSDNLGDLPSTICPGTGPNAARCCPAEPETQPAIARRTRTQPNCLLATTEHGQLPPHRTETQAATARHDRNRANCRAMSRAEPRAGLLGVGRGGGAGGRGGGRGVANYRPAEAETQPAGALPGRAASGVRPAALCAGRVTMPAAAAVAVVGCVVGVWLRALGGLRCHAMGARRALAALRSSRRSASGTPMPCSGRRPSLCFRVVRASSIACCAANRHGVL
jgi:hypothetical protein